MRFYLSILSFFFFAYGLFAQGDPYSIIKAQDAAKKSYIIECSHFKDNGMNRIFLGKDEIVKLNVSKEIYKYKKNGVLVNQISGSIKTGAIAKSVPESIKDEYIKTKEICDYLEKL